MLDGQATDVLEGSSLSFQSEYIDIYSNCWGPKDDGKTFGRPGPLGKKAFEDGAKFGRNGKVNEFSNDNMVNLFSLKAVGWKKRCV